MMSEWGVDEGAQHTALQDARAQGLGCRGQVAHPGGLWSVVRFLGLELHCRPDCSALSMSFILYYLHVL